MKQLIIPVMIAFGVALAYVIGQRMSIDAMAVVLGVAVGVAASVPTSLLLVALLRRQSRRDPYQQPSYPPQLAQPPVIVVNPGQWLAGQQGQAQPLPPVPMMDSGRQINIVGDDAGGWR